MIIKDYWCFGCGLVANTSFFVCSVCGSSEYGVFDMDISKLSDPEHIMKLYEATRLYVHCENGQLALTNRSVGPVDRSDKKVIAARMNSKYILDENGEPQVCEDLHEWGEWLETAERHIAKTWISKDVEVSTIFLGLDRSFGEGPPLLFETMVFGGKHDQDQRRYSTKTEAEKGHEEMVKIVKMCRARTSGVL